MQEAVNRIVEINKDLFGDNLTIKKVNVGFTNTIYNVNDKYIIKICSDIKNESNFQKEINFYNTNKDNNLIPKLYYSDNSKNEIPYYYEILEKIEGVTLYNVWHTFRENEREEIIKQLCKAMKKMHSNIGEYYNWSEYNKKRFNKLFDEVKKQKLFNDDKIEILNKVYSLFDKYLVSDKVVLVHNDIHFDNIFINKGKIKIIDFERSMYAPKDFDLHILYYMIRQPWKHASEDCEKFTKVEDYSNIMSYIEKYYPEIIHIPYLYKRLAIYDVIYELSHFIQFSKHRDELSKAVFDAAKIVLGN